MPTLLDPCLHSLDTAREAMEVSRGVFGGDLTDSTFRDLQGGG